MQGLFSAVWGGTAIIGPAIGGIITTTVGWPWVFWINLPIGIVATILVRAGLPRELRAAFRTGSTGSGAFLLTGGVALLLFTLSEGGDSFGYASPEFVAMLARRRC